MSETNLEAVEVPWSSLLISICLKCGKKFDLPQEENPSEVLRQNVKTLINERGLKKEVRVVTSSCLNVCPKERLTVVASYDHKEPTFKAYTVPPSINEKELLDSLLS
jgi:predicted metal-binding protein